MGNRYSEFACEFEVKSEGEKAATFSGVASTNDVDSHNDIIVAGAFDPIKTKVTPDGTLIPNVMMLRDHDRSQVIGGWRSFKQDGNHLRVEGELTLEVALARETHALMKKGYIGGLSVGFGVRSFDDIHIDEKTGRRTIKKGVLREVSIVGFPANERARVLNVKSELFERLGESDLLELLAKQTGDYPTDTEANIRASWTKFQAAEEALDKIGERIIAAWKTKIDPKGPPGAEPEEAKSKRRDLIKAIDDFAPIDAARINKDFLATISKLKGHFHV